MRKSPESQAKQKPHDAMEGQPIATSSGKKKGAERNGNGHRGVDSRISGGKKDVEMRDGTSGALNYGEDDYVTTNKQRNAPSTSSYPHLAGRRIISYED